jgi:hypothetical protein
MDGSARALSLAVSGDEFAQWDAAYVLGSLSEADRREFEAHLQGCPACRQSVDELSGMPAVLGQLTDDEVAAIDPDMLSSRVLTPLLAKVSRRRRNARFVRWGTVAAAAAAIVFAVTVGVQLRPAQPSSAPPQAAAPALSMTPLAATELTATVAMTSHGWGTQIDMNCNYPAEPKTSGQGGNEPPDRLAMEVVGRNGNHDRLATWRAVEGIDAALVGTTLMPIDQIATVQIVSADTGSVLLQRSA